jgi:large subunit ribosomal protein L3
MPRGIGLLGQKVAMTQVFDREGRAVGATVLQAGPCTVTRLRTKETDGYEAVQMAYREEPKPDVRMTKAVLGVFAKAGVPAHRVLAEFVPHPSKTGPADLAAGSKLTVELFKPGDRVDVQGTSKGHGFQGVVKRHGFKGGPDTHGSMSHRAPGSIGSSTDPGHTLRGTRMGGHHGNKTSTSPNLEVLKVDAEHHLLVVKGAVPGATGSWVRVTPTIKRKAPSARRLWVEVHDAEGAKTAAKKGPAKK